MLTKLKTYHGVFVINEKSLWGELVIAGANTKLMLRTEERMDDSSLPENIFGQLHDFTLVSCIGCVGGAIPNTQRTGDGKLSMSWEIFPHHVISGRQHFDPDSNEIKKIWFSTPDLSQIFNDSDSFGELREPSQSLKELIPKTIGNRDIPIGENPIFTYFTGRNIILSTNFPYGLFECQHWAVANTSSQGATISSDMRIKVEFEEKIKLPQTLTCLLSLGQFLNLIVGRSQTLENIQIGFNDNDGKAHILSLINSFESEESADQNITPHWRDVLLDGIKNPEEFCQVLSNWYSNTDHSRARYRFDDCRRMGNNFTEDRLIAAANMFDLITFSDKTEIDPSLLEVRTACLELLKNVPSSDDRDGVISAFQRIGKPTLRKKILAQIDVLHPHFHLEDLDIIVRQAVLFRNYLVHGPGDKRFVIEVGETHMAFLTETLEFIFAVSELIRNGWRANEWYTRPHVGRHWICWYLHGFETQKNTLLAHLSQVKPQPK
jgi:hypothetical protein